MYRKITLDTTEGPREFGMLATAATALRYRQVFHEDLMAAMNRYSRAEADPDGVDYEMLSKLAYVMHAAASGQDVSKLSVDGHIAWVDGFEAMAFMNAGSDIVGVYTGSQTTSSKQKNRRAPATAK